MAKKNNANIGFEKQIWDAACVLWGHIPAAEYRKCNFMLSRLFHFLCKSYLYSRYLGESDLIVATALFNVLGLKTFSSKMSLGSTLRNTYMKKIR